MPSQFGTIEEKQAFLLSIKFDLALKGERDPWHEMWWTTNKAKGVETAAAFHYIRDHQTTSDDV